MFYVRSSYTSAIENRSIVRLVLYCSNVLWWVVQVEHRVLCFFLNQSILGYSHKKMYTNLNYIESQLLVCASLSDNCSLTCLASQTSHTKYILKIPHNTFVRWHLRKLISGSSEKMANRRHKCQKCVVVKWELNFALMQTVETGWSTPNFVMAFWVI